MTVGHSIFISGHIGVAHSAESGDPSVDHVETLNQKLAGIDGGIGVGVDEAFEAHHFSVRESGDLHADRPGVGVADG